MEQVIRGSEDLKMLEFLQQWLKLAPRGVRVEVEMEEKAVWWPSLGPPARRNYHKVLLILLAIG